MNNIPFVRSKLIIPDLPVRSLFCDRIKNMKITENRISTLTAPAGFGKTTAVLMCLEKYRQNVKWYRLDKEDCFLPVFLFSFDGNIILRREDQRCELH